MTTIKIDGGELTVTQTSNPGAEQVELALSFKPDMDYLARAILSSPVTAPATERANLINMMRNGTDPAARSAKVFGIRLRDMNDDEIRIAAYWMASRLKGF